MKWNEQTQQEAKNLVEALTPAQWKTVCETIPALMKPVSPEVQKADQERRERAKEQREALEADFHAKREAFKVWKEKKLKGLKMPTAYDFSVGDVAPLCDYSLHEVSGHKGFYDTMSFMYDYGFKRGMAYQKKRNKANKA